MKPDIEQFKEWIKADISHTRAWREGAKADFDTLAGRPYTEQEQRYRENSKDPDICFNRVLPVVNSISGMEISNRQEVRYIPREAGDTSATDNLTEISRWFRDQANADDEDSAAFRDVLSCGLGVTETTLNFDENEDGDPVVSAINPLEVYWDQGASKMNLTDTVRRSRIRKMSLQDAMRLFPGKAKKQLDAGWVSFDDDDEPYDAEQSKAYEREGEESDIDRCETITLIQCQWVDWVTEFETINPATMQKEKVSREKLNRIQELWPQHPSTAGFDIPPAVETRRRVVMNTFIGSEVLETGPALNPSRFSFNFITGYHDRNKNQFFGLVRQMRDPQRWANKFLVQSMKIIEANAKGGVFVEKDAFADWGQFLDSYAHPDMPTVVNDGVLAKGKIQPKPQTASPGMLMNLMEFSVSSISDTTGVNVEMLGMRAAGQAASLEHQRKQAGMQIMAPLFDALKRYRKEQGKNLLYIIQNVLSDGRLVRVLGEDGGQYVPLMQNADAEYDVILDEMPASPNQIEMNFAQMSPFMGDMPPPVKMEFIKEYAPGSKDAKQKLSKAIQAAMQPDPMAAQMKQIELAKGKAEAAQDQSSAALNMAKVATEQAKAGLEQAKTQRERIDQDADTVDNIVSMADMGAQIPGAV